LSQEAQVQSEIEVGHRFVQESGVTGLVPRQKSEDLGHDRVGILQSAAEFFVQQESRELGSARPLQELDEYPSTWPSDLGSNV